MNRARRRALSRLTICSHIPNHLCLSLVNGCSSHEEPRQHCSPTAHLVAFEKPCLRSTANRSQMLNVINGNPVSRVALRTPSPCLLWISEQLIMDLRNSHGHKSAYVRVWTWGAVFSGQLRPRVPQPGTGPSTRCFREERDHR